MKNKYTQIIVIGIIAEITILIFFDKKIASYGPVIFWGIALIGMLKYASNIFKLSDSVKKTKPKLYKTHSFGVMLTSNALSNKDFLSELNEYEKKIIEDNKVIFKHLLYCFILFALSAFLIFLK